MLLYRCCTFITTPVSILRSYNPTFTRSSSTISLTSFARSIGALLQPITTRTYQISCRREPLRTTQPPLPYLFFAAHLRLFATEKCAVHQQEQLQHDHKFDHKCWSCDHFLKQERPLFCASCHIIQRPPSDLNFFDLFKIPQSYDIDAPRLEKVYTSLQREVHPDLFCRKSPTEKELSAINSSNINEAFSTLKHPVKRAVYLLQLHNIDFSEQVITDQETLLELMEDREEIADLEPDQLGPIRAKYEAKKSNTMSQLAKAFATGNLEDAQRLTGLLNYQFRILETIHEKQPVS